VHYRGGFARFFRYLSLTGTPAAVAANLLILLFAQARSHPTERAGESR